MLEKSNFLTKSKNFVKINGENMGILDLTGNFVWSFGKEFHIATDKGNYEWSCPDYPGGDDTLKPCGSYGEWLDKIGIEFGRCKGRHVIKDYCGESVVLIEPRKI